MKVIKRDGRLIDFDSEKITRAIGKAIYAISNQTDINSAANDKSIAKTDIASLVSKDVEETIRALNKESIAVEDIQDIVEKSLIKHNQPEIAKEYILYRDKRNKARKLKSNINKTINGIINIDAKDNDTKRENANIDANSVMGSMLKVGSTVMKDFYLTNLFKPQHVKMHNDGILHQHDLDFVNTINCIQIPLDKLLKKGYSTGHGFLRSPATIRSAAALTCIAIQSSQNDFFN